MAEKEIKNEDSMAVGSETEEEKPEVKGVGVNKTNEEVKEDKEKKDVKPEVHSSGDTAKDGGSNETELNDDKKYKLVQDLSWICSVDAAKARAMLEANKWDMQGAIDAHFENRDSDDDSDVMVVDKESKSEGDGDVMVLGSETEDEKTEGKKSVSKASGSGGAGAAKAEVKDKKGEEDNDDGPSFSIAEVAIELTDELKGKFVQDLSWICSVDVATARRMLEANKWNMQKAIDTFFDNPDSDDEDADVVMVSGSPADKKKVKPEVVTLDDVTSPNADGKKEKEIETEKSGTSQTSAESFSSWAPEKLSVISWNLDGLDEKNLEKRTDAVIEIILREGHDVIFFQELVPFTFDYIARRLCSKYMPIPGTEDSSCDYLTATFLKLNQVHYEDHSIIPFPNTTMGRSLLVTKVFIGQAKIALMNTHLESTAEFSNERRVQLKQCFEIAKGMSPEYNVLFGGDLNLRDKEVTGVMPANMEDLWVRCGSRESCKYTWDLTRNSNKQMPGRFQPRCRFDRFYFKMSRPATLDPEFFGVTGIEKVINTQSFPSDHWAILAFFRLSKEARKPSAKKRSAETAFVMNK